MHAGFAGAARKTASIAAAAMLLGGCLSSGTEEEAADTGSFGDRQLSGSVGDGPVVNAEMRVMSKSGELIAEFQSDMQGGYNVTVSARDSQYPLTLDATGGTDLVTGLPPDFVLRGAVWSSSNRATGNVNPFSTFAFETARDLGGGLNADNLRTAEDIVVTALNSGLSTLASSGPMTTGVDAGNVAEMVKASEALAETVRRTAAALDAAGFARSADQVVQALGSDLVDEVIEGSGPRADSRIAAVAIVVHAQVLLETMANEVHVNGVNATEAMRSAIEEVSPGTASPTLDELTVTAAMLAKAQLGILAAFSVTGDPTVQSLGDSVEGIQAGMDWTLVKSLLPADYRSRLNAAIAQIAGGDAATLNTVNDVARDDSGMPPPANRAPVLSGTPPASVTAGNAYAFTPAASDPDGDSLSFSISGRPGWASFDTTSGRLSGTPGNGDVGTYAGIVIRASDGELTTSLPAFTITVEPVSSSSAPSLSGTPPSSVTAGNAYSFTPTANDPNGDPLSFEVSNLPSWADFNTGNGRISGTPSASDVGLYDNIRITVSDGSESDTLGPFSIEVVAQGGSTGSATLSWDAPTENEDGTPLTDLAGYRLYWGTTSGSYPNSVTINNPGVTTYVVDNLPSGTYEFVATAFNTSGFESRFSNPATKTVP